MRERPILFSAPMVRAILAGDKTQTRRVIANRSRAFSNTIMVDEGDGWWPHASDDCESHICYDGNERPIACPYGIAGDRLWLRETWAAPHNCDYLKPSEIDRGWRIHYAASEDRGGLLWRPSIFMPRWASRITLEITGVRVEQLQAISEADAMAEGVEPLLVPPDGGGAPHVEGYRALWESIHGVGSWDANPWVWVVEFRRA